MTEQNWRDINFTSFDGLNIYARCYEASQPSGMAPVLCLPGLTRNSQDFHYLATHLSQQTENQRDVYCIDLRGRGRSDYDRDWKNYTTTTELRDVLDLTAIEGIHKASVIGTSRGGLIMMIMAAARPTLIETAILNDIGPVIDTQGLLRIRSYAGSLPVVNNWSEACRIIRSINEKQFTHLSDEEWMIIARQSFLEDEGRPIPSYDTELGKPLAEIDFTEPLPTAWPQFLALSKFPLMVLRGENSDLLSAETMQEMQERAPGMYGVTIENQGHAPFFIGEEINNTIYDFLEKSGKPH
ncbi:MAG: alpha/beta fold hydrolase [Methyloligellaceae bacterium]